MNKPGRFYGMIAFFNIIFSCIATYVIIILSGVQNWAIRLDLLLSILGIAMGVFLTTWGAIWGTGAIKTFKEKP